MEMTDEEMFERNGEILSALSLIERDWVAFMDGMATGLKDALQAGSLPTEAAQRVPEALEEMANRRDFVVDCLQRAREAIDAGAAETFSGAVSFV